MLQHHKTATDAGLLGYSGILNPLGSTILKPFEVGPQQSHSEVKMVESLLSHIEVCWCLQTGQEAKSFRFHMLLLLYLAWELDQSSADSVRWRGRVSPKSLMSAVNVCCLYLSSLSLSKKGGDEGLSDVRDI